MEFSTLRFLKVLEKESIRKLKLLQLIILIIRTIIILFIILMITRPTLKGAFSVYNSGESTLHAIILDDSFSLLGNMGSIQKAAENILRQIPDKGQLIWLNINDGLQYKGLKEDMPPLANLLDNTYQSKGVLDGLNSLRQNIENKYINKEVYILTDGQDESMQNLFKNADLFEDMHLYLIIAPQINNNLSITNVKILNEILVPNNSINLEVSVKNTGNIIKENILLQLIIDNMSVGQQLVSLPPKKENIFLFNTAVAKTGVHEAMLELDSDDKEADNRYFLNLHIPHQRKIAIIRKSQEESYYLITSLRALNKSGKSLSVSEYTSFEDPKFILKNYEVIFIISPAMLKNVYDSRIENYLNSGGHLIIFPSIASLPDDYNFMTNTGLISDDNYSSLVLTEFSEKLFQNIDASAIQMSDIYNLFYSSNNKERNIRIFKYYNLPYDPAFSQLLLNNGSSIWNRYNDNIGIIDIFGFAINLNWTNLPIKGAFLPFTQFLTYSQNTGNGIISEVIGNNWEVLLEDHYSGTIFHILPDGTQKIMNTNANNYLISDILEYPGYHRMQSDGNNISKLAVNVDINELNCNYASIITLQDNASENMRIIPMKNDITAEIKQARIGIEIWRYFLISIIILIMIEMFISNVPRKS